MAEFGVNSGGGGGGFEDNWGLEAIVRGGSTMSTTTSAFSTGPDSSYLDDDIDNGSFFLGFPDDNLLLTNDLQDYYKPFYPLTDSSPSSNAVQDHITFDENEIKEKPFIDGAVQRQQLSPLAPAPPPDQSAAIVNIAQTPKYRRRKNQNKRVVVQAAGAEGLLPSDMWAWRKYGQKPIKGSPYPRSYYRCSSSKVCLAKKQVEQSYTDPGVFIISYAAEHNHTQPIKKNALAGTTRPKFPIQINPAPTAAVEYKENSCNSNWSSSAPSPMSGASNIEDGCSSDVKQENIKSKLDIKMEEEFFAGLEDLDGLIAELARGQEHYSSQIFSMNFYS